MLFAAGMFFVSANSSSFLYGCLFSLFRLEEREMGVKKERKRGRTMKADNDRISGAYTSHFTTSRHSHGR